MADERDREAGRIEHFARRQSMSDIQVSRLPHDCAALAGCRMPADLAEVLIDAFRELETAAFLRGLDGVAAARAERFAAGVSQSAQVADAERRRAEEQKARNIADYPDDLHNSANQYCNEIAYTAKIIAAGIRALSPLRPVAEVCGECEGKKKVQDRSQVRQQTATFSHGWVTYKPCESCSGRGAVVRWEESDNG